MASSSFAADWTGGYVGGQLGYVKVKPSAVYPSKSGGAVGIHAGYDYDFGDWVLGGELNYDRTNIDLVNSAASPSTVNVDYVARAKLKLGYDFGNALGYVVGGPARVKTSVGSQTDPFYGIGVSFLVSPLWSVSGEYLYHKFKNVGGSGIDTRADSFTIRASYRF